MKKFLKLFFCLSLIVGFSACGGSSDAPGQSSNWDEIEWDQGKWG